MRGSDNRKLSGHLTLTKQLQVFLDISYLPSSLMLSSTGSIRQILEINKGRNFSLAAEGVRSLKVSGNTQQPSKGAEP